MSKYSFPIVFMTDRIVDGKEYCMERNDAEGNSRKVAYEIRDTLASLCQEVLMLEDPKEYTNLLPSLNNWVMFSTHSCFNTTHIHIARGNCCHIHNN